VLNSAVTAVELGNYWHTSAAKQRNDGTERNKRLQNWRQK